MDLPLNDRLRIGVQTIHRRTEPAEGPWLPTIDEMRTLVELVDRGGYDSLWVGDHISFALPIFDPFLQLAQAAVVSRACSSALRFTPAVAPSHAGGQAGYDPRSPDRGPGHLRRRRRREFPKEYEACGVPIAERGARLSESFTVLRKLWSGKPASHAGRFFQFEEVFM